MMKNSSNSSNSSSDDDDHHDRLSLQEMPEDLVRHVAQYLSAPDILRLLCVHPHIHKSCGSSTAFWNMLSRAHNSDDDDDNNDADESMEQPIHGTNTIPTHDNNALHDHDHHHLLSATEQQAAVAAKRNFLLRAYTTLLPRVRWIPISNRHEMDPRVPDSREGHLACALGTQERPVYVIHGGFTDDANVYCLYKPHQHHHSSSSNNSSNNNNNNIIHASTTTTAAAATLNGVAAAAALTTVPTATWLQVIPSYSPPNVTPCFVYGASLTRLDAKRAVRFGGFQSGGYTGETNQVAVLTIDVHHSDDDNNNNDESGSGPAIITAHWEVITMASSSGVTAQARGYHTANLLQDRYLLIVGGMTSGGSILQEAMLDTHTWQWLNVSVSVSTFGAATAPSGRHGHSMIVDARRNRLVLFGGGSGTDLLRSGTDNTEVWELKMGEAAMAPGSASLWKTNLLASLPWKWNQLYTSANPEVANDEGDAEPNHGEAAAAAAATAAVNANTNTIPSSPLSLVESLCLGRCHVAFRVSVDSVVFCFGAGRPSTNGVLAYDLRTDTFLRPHVEGYLPRPRFTAASVLFEDEGYLLVHGGYSTQAGDTTHDFAVLDLAPSLQRSFDWLPVREEVGGGGVMQRHPPIVEDDIRRVQRTVQQGADIGVMMRNLTEMTPEMRQRMALQYMGAGGLEAHNANLLRIIIGAHAAQMPARQHDIHVMMDSLHRHMEEFGDDDDDEDDDEGDADEDDENFDENEEFDEDEDDDMLEH